MSAASRQKGTWREMLNDDGCNHPGLKRLLQATEWRQQHSTEKKKKKEKEEQLLILAKSYS